MKSKKSTATKKSGGAAGAENDGGDVEISSHCIREVHIFIPDDAGNLILLRFMLFQEVLETELAIVIDGGYKMS